MNYIKVKNTEDVELKLLFKGENYKLGASKTESFPEDVAAQWVTIYEFLTLENSKEEVKEVKETKTTKK
jgi:hypothetical protein